MNYTVRVKGQSTEHRKFADAVTQAMAMVVVHRTSAEISDGYETLVRVRQGESGVAVIAAVGRAML